MNKIQEFFNEKFGTVRATKINNDIFFVGKDIAEKLGYKDPSATISKKCKNGLKTMLEAPCQNGNVVKTQTTIIPESDVFRLIVGSKLPSAEEFENWVMEDILPTIRQTGGFVEEDREDEFINKYFPSFSEDVKLAMVQDLLKTNKELKNKSNKWDKFLDSNGTYNFTEVSKLISTMGQEEKSDISISVVKLTDFLRNEGVLSKAKTPDKPDKKGSYKNLPNKDFEEYFDVVSVKTKGDFNKTQTRVKATGVEYIYDLVKNKYNKAI